MTDDRGERGSAGITVMGIGLLAVTAAMVLASICVAEYRATEDSLMQVRAYWASMGQAAYVLSRTAQTGACNTKTCPPPPAGGGNPPDYQAAAQAYLKEITSGATPLQTWLYPDVNASYQFTMQQTVCTDPLASSSRLGEMLLVSAVGGAAACPPAPPASGVPIATKCPAPPAPPKGTLPVLSAVQSVRPVEVRYCLVAAGVTTCGAGPGQTTSGANLITSVHRPSC